MRRSSYRSMGNTLATAGRHRDLHRYAQSLTLEGARTMDKNNRQEHKGRRPCICVSRLSGPLPETTQDRMQRKDIILFTE